MDFSNLLQGFKIELASRLIAQVCGALTIVLLARFLGVRDYGLLFLAISVFGFLQVFSKLGVAKSSARYIAEYKEKKPGQIPHIISVSLLYNTITISVVSGVMLLSHEYIATWLGEPDLKPLLLLGILYVLFSTTLTYVRLTIQGFERVDIAGKIQIINGIAKMVFVVGFVLAGFGVIGALVGYIVSFALVSIIGIGVIYTQFYQAYQADLSMESGLRRRIAEYAVPLTATYTADAIDKKIDTVLIGLFLGPVAVGLYEISKQIVTFIEAPAAALGFATSPAFGSLEATGNLEKVATIYENAVRYTLLLYIPAAIGLFLVAEPTIRLIFGNQYVEATPVVQVLSLFVVLQAVMNSTSKGLDYLGRARERAIIQTFTSIFNVILNIIFIPVYGVVGAATATIITYGIYTLLSVYIMIAEVNLEISNLYQDILIIVMISILMAVPVSQLLGYIDGWFSLLLVVLVGVFIWALSCFITGIISHEKLKSIIR